MKNMVDRAIVHAPTLNSRGYTIYHKGLMKISI